MKTITVAQLRQNPTQALADVEAGESYVVTKHRRAIAHLVPADEDRDGFIPPRQTAPVRLEEWPDWPSSSGDRIDELVAWAKGDR